VTGFFGAGKLSGMTETIGFVGVGIMGSGMVKNLKAKGHTVLVWGRTQAKVDAFVKETGVTAVGSLQELAEKSTVLMLCVTNTGDVEEVLFGKDGAVAGLKPGSLVLDCSTISPKATQKMAAQAVAKGMGFVDAPVSGGSEGAAQGTLSIMAGGAEKDFERAKPILEAIGTRLTYMGEAGTGQTTKLLNQILVVVNMLAASEALVFGQAAGVDLRKAVTAVEAGAAGSWMLSKRAPQILDDYWQPGFTIDLQKKDLDLVLEYAAEIGVPLETTSKVRDMYARLQSEGKGALGNHGLILAFKEFHRITK
jgi:3-hydroxyisobutyrate dehydrogenase